MLLRLIAGTGLVIGSAGLIAFGYHVGREVGRMESIREELKTARDAKTRDTAAPNPDVAVAAPKDTPAN